MKIVYHGTGEVAAEKILNEGFAPFTYFATDLLCSLTMGGPYVFAVQIDIDEDDPQWQPRPEQAVPPDRILWLVRFDMSVLWYGSDNATEARRRFVDADGGVMCERCSGSGERNALPFYPKIRNPRWRTVEACEHCCGFGEHTEHAKVHEGMACAVKSVEVLAGRMAP